MTPSFPGIEFTSVHHDVYPAINLSRSTFEGRRVFISGASKGIGREAAIAYAKAGAAAICLGARSDLSLVEQDVQEAAAAAGKKPPKVLSVNLDVSSRRSVEAAANAVAQCCESIDVLVNNAGYHSRFETITESDPDDWWKSWETVRLPTSGSHNTHQVDALTRYCIEYLRNLFDDPIVPSSAPERLGQDHPQYHLNCFSTSGQGRKCVLNQQTGHASVFRIHQR